MVPNGCRTRQTAAEDNRQLLFPNGLEVTQDPAEALRWSRAAAEQGHAEAQANTGLIYARGIGCEPDYVEAGGGTSSPLSRVVPPASWVLGSSTLMVMA